MGPTQGIYCTVRDRYRAVPYRTYKQYVSTALYCTVVYRMTWYGSVSYVASYTLCFYNIKWQSSWLYLALRRLLANWNKWLSSCDENGVYIFLLVVVVVVLMPLVVGCCRFRRWWRWLYFTFGQETPGAHKFWHMMLPLITSGLLRDALRKLTTANTMGFCCCYR